MCGLNVLALSIQSESIWLDSNSTAQIPLQQFCLLFTRLGESNLEPWIFSWQKYQVLFNVICWKVGRLSQPSLKIQRKITVYFALQANSSTSIFQTKKFLVHSRNFHEILDFRGSIKVMNRWDTTPHPTHICCVFRFIYGRFQGRLFQRCQQTHSTPTWWMQHAAWKERSASSHFQATQADSYLPAHWVILKSS